MRHIERQNDTGAMLRYFRDREGFHALPWKSWEDRIVAGIVASMRRGDFGITRAIALAGPHLPNRSPGAIEGRIKKLRKNGLP